jgi:radical SAM protein with 4Fe4S-binding SPASM domain
VNNIILKLRNIFEANGGVEKIGNILTNNQIYRSIVLKIAKKKIEKIKKNKTYNIAFETSSFCNGHCTFCPNSFMKRKKENMSILIFKKAVERIKEEKIIPLNINLTGTGEPLIDKTIFEKIDILKKNWPNSNVYLPTNFELANSQIIKKLLNSKLDSIAISLNANTAKEYKNIMGLNFKKTINNINQLIKQRILLKKSIKIYITLAANPLNKKNINKFIKRWEQKVDGIAVNWIHSWAGAVDNKKNDQKQTRFPCRPLFDQIIIHSNGNIPLCLVDYEGKHIGGNVSRNKILKSYYSKKLNKIRKLQMEGKFKNLEMCSKCRFSERGMYWLV